ncbi:sulfite exporter TauE/SafE family protein [Sulfobacillus thermosulfidooxidans]|uniref:sulfite exporter TauE/SafE family protein n=1 Tax=Sulfobacillus thermosulfidooxidans TaxID=28034 RepID=UPI0003F5E917|nr:sulfite exporter TauE/SafE family protein [Sulfobacillus thermosulfidooxidans]
MLTTAVVLIFLVSVLFAMLGMGGGMLHVPILLWLGFDLKTVAQPLGILLNGLTSLMALITYWRHGLVDWKGSLPLALAALALAPLGAWVARFIPEHALLIMFFIVIILAAFRTLQSLRKPEPVDSPPRDRWVWATLGAGLAALAGGMLGLGGGTFISPLLMWMGYPTKQAVATTAYIVTFSSFSGFLGRVEYFHAPWTFTVILSITVIVAAAIGSRLMATKAKPQWIKVAYSLLLVGVGIKLVL